MRILVLIKQMLDPSGVTVRRDKERIFVNREEYILDPGSKAALEAALRIREAHAGTGAGPSVPNVAAMSMGEPRADDALREALAMGCDTAYLLSDPDFEAADAAVTTRILAAAIEKLEGADLVLAGREAGDSGDGQVGPGLAEALGYAGASDVWHLELDDAAVAVICRWGEGFAAVRIPLPAVVTVAPEAFRPRYARGARIINAYRDWDVTVWNGSDLELAPEALAPLVSLRGEGFPPPLEVGEQYRGDPEAIARDLVLTLKQHKLAG
jgi:electron transfer flavoprotein beta subunit